MSIRPVGFPALVFLVCVLDFPPFVAQADQIPSFIDTTAYGSVDFAYNGTTGALYGPDASINTDSAGVNSPFFFSATVGTPFPSSSVFPGFFQFVIPPFNSVPNSILEGSVTLGDQSYGVIYSGANVLIQASVAVPAGYASVQLPAVFSAGGTSCLNGFPFYGCYPPPPENADIVADVGFDVPGILTVNFSPAGPPQQVPPNLEFFDAVFTPGSFAPVPEPSSSLLVLFALAAAAIWRLYAQRRAGTI